MMTTVGLGSRLGVEPGEYFVTISWNKLVNPKDRDSDEGPDLLPEKYKDHKTSGLRVEIVAGDERAGSLRIDSLNELEACGVGGARFLRCGGWWTRFRAANGTVLLLWRSITVTFLRRLSMSRVRKRTRGFTLIELLVVIAIIAVLVSLLLPAVQQAREAARKTQCRNNLKQLGLALMNYESSYKVFPMEKITFTPVAQTWTTMVLPFLDQQPMYDLYNFSLEWSNPAQWPVTTTQLPVWVCPSAPGVDGRATIATGSTGATLGDAFPPGGYGLCDYMALSGVRASLYVVTGLPMPPAMALSAVNVASPGPPVWKENRWPCAMHSTQETKISQISDGMSNTLMIAEDAGRPGLFVSRQKVPAPVPPFKTPSTSDGWGWADTGNSGAIDGCTYDGTFVNSSKKAIPPACRPVPFRPVARRAPIASSTVKTTANCSRSIRAGSWRCSRMATSCSSMRAFRRRRLVLC